MNSFEKQALTLGLRRLFDPAGHFGMWDFDSLLKLVRVTLPQSEEIVFRAVSGVKYSDMTPEFRQELFERVIEIFERDPDIILNVEEIFPPARHITVRKWFPKLLTGSD